MSSRTKIYYTEPEHWDQKELMALQDDFKRSDFAFDRKAAIGEGAGGAGFETIIELVIAPMAVGLLTNLLYDLAKKAIKRQPRDRGGPEELKRYRLVVHYEDKILSIDLKQPPEIVEVAIKEALPKVLRGNVWRAHQKGKTWDVFKK